MSGSPAELSGRPGRGFCRLVRCKAGPAGRARNADGGRSQLAPTGTGIRTHKLPAPSWGSSRGTRGGGAIGARSRAARWEAIAPRDPGTPGPRPDPRRPRPQAQPPAAPPRHLHPGARVIPRRDPGPGRPARTLTRPRPPGSSGACLPLHGTPSAAGPRQTGRASRKCPAAGPSGTCSSQDGRRKAGTLGGRFPQTTTSVLCAGRGGGLSGFSIALCCRCEFDWLVDQSFTARRNGLAEGGASGGRKCRFPS